MSWQAISHAEKISMQYRLPATFTLILERIAGGADKAGEGSRKSVSTLVLETRTSESTVHRAIRHFLRMGIITYGDHSLVADIPADRRPRVYNMVFDAAERHRLMMSSVGREPREKTPSRPVDKSPAKPERGVTVTKEEAPAGCHSERQTFKPLKINQAQPPADAVSASPEVVDHGIRYREEIRARRLAKQGLSPEQS